MNTNAQTLSILRLLIGAASLAVLVGAMWTFSSFLAPILLALFFSILFTPIYHWLTGKGLPTAVALTIMIVGALVFGLALIAFIVTSFEQLAGSLSAYRGQISQNVESLQTSLADMGIEVTNWFESTDSQVLVQAAVSFLARLGSVAASAMIVLIVIIFALVEAASFREKLQRELGPENPLVVRMTQFSQIVVRYFVLRTLVNLITGAAVTVMLLLLGIDFALLWGML